MSVIMCQASLFNSQFVKEAIVQRCPLKKVVLEISHNSQENS